MLLCGWGPAVCSQVVKWGIPTSGIQGLVFIPFCSSYRGCCYVADVVVLILYIGKTFPKINIIRNTVHSHNLLLQKKFTPIKPFTICKILCKSIPNLFRSHPCWWVQPSDQPRPGDSKPQQYQNRSIPRYNTTTLHCLLM